MIVCICHHVSDRDIEREARAGCASFEALQHETYVATACGACTGCARQTFDRACAGASAAEHRLAHAPQAQHAVVVMAGRHAVRSLRRVPAFAPVLAAAA